MVKDLKIWIYNFNKSTWSTFENGTTPGYRFYHTAVLDVTNAMIPQMIIYGGANESHTLGDLWSFNFTNRSWKEFTESGITPGPREKINFISTYGRIVIFGGFYNKSVSYNDLWSIIIETDCYQFGSDCYNCTKSIGCGWCNMNTKGFQCIGGYKYPYIQTTCNVTSNSSQMDNFTKDFLMCPIEGFPGWIVALLTLVIPMLIGGVYFLVTFLLQHTKSQSPYISINDGTPEH